jgi:hypothetical protein
MYLATVKLGSYGRIAASQSSAAVAVVSELSADPRLIAYAPEYVKGSAAAIGNSESLNLLVAYLGLADKYFGPLATRLRRVNQPVIRTRNGFSAPHPTQLACI